MKAVWKIILGIGLCLLAYYIPGAGLIFILYGLYRLYRWYGWIWIEKLTIRTTRSIVGALFVVSGLIKSNDAYGFMYKLQEYFEPGAMDMLFLDPYALHLAVFVCVAEVLLGIALLVGALPKLTTTLTTVMMVFFTFLTWYTATCDPQGTSVIVDAMGQEMEISNQCVLECGCFGNAIPLTPWQSFIKDIILLVLVLPIVISAFRNKVKLNDTRDSFFIYTGALVMTFLFGYMMLDWNFPTLYLVILLLGAEAVKRRVKSSSKQVVMALTVLFIASLFQYYTLAHLPVKDYRPYAEGENINWNMLTAEEQGFEAAVYDYHFLFENNDTGEEVIVTDWSNQVDSAFQATHTSTGNKKVLVKEAEAGYFDQPRIMDLIMENSDGEDLTEQVLANNGYTFIHISNDLTASGGVASAELNSLAINAIEAGHDFYCLSNEGYESSEDFKHEFQVPYEFLTCDQTELKIIIRSNPGLVLIKGGEVVEKWAWRDIPTFEELELK